MSSAVSTLISTQGMGDLYQLYLLSQRDNIDFNVAYIPQTFTRRLERPFDTAYMQEFVRRLEQSDPATYGPEESA